MDDLQQQMISAIAWCLAWGNEPEPAHPIQELQALRQSILNHQTPQKPALEAALETAKTLASFLATDFSFPQDKIALEQLVAVHPALWNGQIGLVYGGVTKVKDYVFESADLHEIRGASGLLDRINLIDLPAFFKAETDARFPQCQQAKNYCQQVHEWLEHADNFPGLADALIPELIVYSTGGNILAFCPAAYCDLLADAIEKRYTTETLTANSCAVGRSFRLLETHLGRLATPLTKTRWLDWYQQHRTTPLLAHLLGTSPGTTPSEDEVETYFKAQKGFSELVRELTIDFDQRRSGCITETASPRPPRCYPPMFETHPYLRRDEGDHRSAVFQAADDPNQPNTSLPNEPWFSEASARKRLMGQITKRELNGEAPSWWEKSGLEWPSVVDVVDDEQRLQQNDAQQPVNPSWISRFEQDLKKDAGCEAAYFTEADGRPIAKDAVEEARSVREIADAALPDGGAGSGYLAYIYADGNNMGSYIRRQIKSPQQYQTFSQDVFKAIITAVYAAIRTHLKPRKYKPPADSSRQKKNEIWLYPFEVVAIGGDDVLLIVPADQALAVAKTLGDVFEQQLQAAYRFDKNYSPEQVHRYRSDKLPAGSGQSELSLSAGVLITAQDTPFYYAEDLTSQLMKSAKKRAKKLREQSYYGGTVDFLVMKSVTMISSNLEQYRRQGLTHSPAGQPILKQYAAPYTLYELGGLLDTAQALKAAKFPRSQLYQIRSLLERSRKTAMLNYRYFRLRLPDDAQLELKTYFEEGWCWPKDPDNTGNLAPWMTYVETGQDKAKPSPDPTTYETLWRELVDLYPFIAEAPAAEATSAEAEPTPMAQSRSTRA